MAVIERIRRALAGVSDHVSAVIGPVSQQYGEAFGCEPWAVQLFPEEVVRGGPAFAVSLVLSSMEPHMRKAAELGAWQVISPSPCMGRLEVVPDLHSIQEKVYEQPTILLAKHVSGEEEVPAGVVGLIRWVGGGGRWLWHRGTGAVGQFCCRGGTVAGCTMQERFAQFAFPQCRHPCSPRCCLPARPFPPPAFSPRLLACSGETCDVLSHLSVRSRNMGVLFASCYDAGQLEEVEHQAGKQLAFETTSAGAVKWREVDAKEAAASAAGGCVWEGWVGWWWGGLLKLILLVYSLWHCIALPGPHLSLPAAADIAALPLGPSPADAAGTAAKRTPIRVTIPKWSGKWVVGMDGFKNEVGGCRGCRGLGWVGSVGGWGSEGCSRCATCACLPVFLSRHVHALTACSAVPPSLPCPPGCGRQVQEPGWPARQAARLDRPALLHHGALVG